MAYNRIKAYGLIKKECSETDKKIIETFLEMKKEKLTISASRDRIAKRTFQKYLTPMWLTIPTKRDKRRDRLKSQWI